jgi:hypothetical protein
MIPDIDIWRAANLMLKRHGEKRSMITADELAATGDYNGEAVWHRISTAIVELENQTPSGPVH